MQDLRVRGGREAREEAREDVALGGREREDGLDVAARWGRVRADGQRGGGCAAEGRRGFWFGLWVSWGRRGALGEASLNA